jgi:hypothetical protein
MCSHRFIKFIKDATLEKAAFFATSFLKTNGMEVTLWIHVHFNHEKVNSVYYEYNTYFVL